MHIRNKVNEASEKQYKTKTSSECKVNEKQSWQGRAGQGRAGQGRAGQGRAGQGRAGQGRAGQGRAGQGRAGQGRAGQGRAGQGRAGQGRAGQGRAGQDFDIDISSVIPTFKMWDLLYSGVSLILPHPVTK